MTCFLGANSGAGFVSYYMELQQYDTLHILKGGAGCGKSTLMKKVAETAEKAGIHTIHILCSSDPDSLDGLLLPALSYAIVDGTSPHVVEPRFCGCAGSYCNLGAGYDLAALTKYRAELLNLQTQNRHCYRRATAYFAASAALLKVGIPETATQSADALLSELRDRCLPRLPHCGTVRNYFFAGLTPSGILRFDPAPITRYVQQYQLIDPCHLSGDAMRSFALSAASRGYDLILGHNPLVPEDLDEILIPSISVAILRRSTVQNERVGEQFLLSDPLSERAYTESQALLQSGLTFIAKAKTLHDRMEEICIPHMDFNVAEKAAKQFCREVLQLARQGES